MLKRNINKLCLFFTVMTVLSACSPSQPNETSKNTQLTVSVAASMADALDEVVTKFEEEHPDIDVLLNVGSSGGLQQQIAQGAPVDLFLSAASDKMDVLREQGLLDERYTTPLVTNQIVLIRSSDVKQLVEGFRQLNQPAIEKIAIGTPESVPAGMYAKQTLESRNVFEAVEEKIVFGKDVTQVLTYVETGNVQVGMVYATDAVKSDKVEVVGIANEIDHDNIQYPLAILKDTKHPQHAVKFYQFLTSEQAVEVFQTYGFTPIEVAES
ncbi:molybdate ABC transporter substrate-binding protein [Aquibacillus sediminis]|uniref:molybdate ABC transporter substrate-binding protein n=1 Tax=Aquibacillus sediminis TaxID=2574734 RepID=UPI001FE28654|nr:molybdate ABC transporter substrate-binding protein [Aquibacillus sediminis]